MANPGRMLLLATALTGVVAACGADRTGGPRGDPASVVGRSPDRTTSQRSARVTVATPEATAEGTVDFATGRARMKVRPASARTPELTNPARALDVVRGAVGIKPYGGAEVRGASTIRYELDVAVGDQTFYADVFVDSAGRIRRVAFPLDPTERRPSRTNRILARLVTVDFYDFSPPAKEPA